MKIRGWINGRSNKWLTASLDSNSVPASKRRSDPSFPTSGNTIQRDPDIDRMLADEYKMLLGLWDDFDRRALSIKGWTAAGSAAAVIAAAGSNISSLAKILVLCVVLSSIWYLEANWKVFQHANGPRINAIEDHFAGLHQLQRPLQALDWSESVKQLKDSPTVFDEMMLPIVFIPYVPVMIVGSLVFLLFQ